MCRGGECLPTICGARSGPVSGWFSGSKCVFGEGSHIPGRQSNCSTQAPVDPLHNFRTTADRQENRGLRLPDASKDFSLICPGSCIGAVIRPRLHGTSPSLDVGIDLLLPAEIISQEMPWLCEHRVRQDAIRGTRFSRATANSRLCRVCLPLFHTTNRSFNGQGPNHSMNGPVCMTRKCDTVR